jgi:O-antigen/teichoic acid export membrane protein
VQTLHRSLKDIAMFSDIKRLMHHSGIYLLGNILNRIGAFVLLPLYTTYLPVADYGALEILYATVAVISIVLAAGLSHTTLRFYFEQKEDNAKRAVVTTNLLLVMAAGIIGASIVFLFRAPIAQLLFDSTRFTQALSVCLAIMVLEMATEIGFAYMRAKEKSLLYVVLSFLRLLLQISLSIYLVVRKGMGIDGVLLANLASVTLGWLVVCGYAVKACGLRFQRALVKPMLMYSLPMAASALVASIAMNADRFLIKEILSLEAVGIYALAMKFALLLSFLVSEPFTRAYSPFRFSIMDQANAGEIQSLILRHLVTATSFVALGVALFMPEVLHFLAGKSYHAAHLYTPFLLAAVVVSMATYCFETGILVKKKTKYLLYIAIATLFAKVALNLLLIAKFGLYGAAAAYFLSAIVQAYLVNRASQQLMPIDYPYLAMWRAGILAAALYACSTLLDYRDWQVSIPLKILLVIAFVAVTYWSDHSVRDLMRRGMSMVQRRRLA